MRYLIGIGNYTQRDDSIGLRVAEAIGEAGLDCGFRSIDLGGNMLDLLHYLGEDTESVLIVDAARMGLEPGEHAFFTPEVVESRKSLAGISTHEGDLMKVLEFARALGQPLPPITVLGIEPGDVGPELGLSPEVERRFAEYCEVAVAFFAKR